MSDPLPQAGLVENGQQQAAFLLEKHSFSGGLQVDVLGSGKARPSWAPPWEYVGLKHEFQLQPGDYITEFARFTFADRRITWIAVYRPAPDRQHGDRHNHEGVGVWLLNHDAVHVGRLLESLRSFTDLTGPAGEIDDRADLFRTNHLHKYLRPSANFPSHLAGWSFSRGRIMASASFVAAGVTQDEAWRLAGDQILRSTHLEGPTPDHSRALVLVRAGAASDSSSASAQPVVPFTASELIAQLPRALEQVEQDKVTALRQAQAAAEATREREAALAAAAARNAQIEQRVADLTQEAEQLRVELQASDPQRERAMLRDAVREVSQQVSDVKAAVQTAHKDLVDEVRRIKPRGGGASPTNIVQPLSDLGERTLRGNEKYRRNRWPLIVAAAAALLVILVALYVIFLRPAPASPPIAEPDVQYTTNPSSAP
jgi:hypothetical protein